MTSSDPSPATPGHHKPVKPRLRHVAETLGKRCAGAGVNHSRVLTALPVFRGFAHEANDVGAATMGAAITLLAAGCGGKNKRAASSGSPAATPTTGGASVGVQSAKLGKILVDASGRISYVKRRMLSSRLGVGCPLVGAHGQREPASAFFGGGRRSHSSQTIRPEEER